MGATEGEGEARERVLSLLKRYGWNSTSFQTLESHFLYWFDGADACVAYVDTGGAWVAAGAPIAAEAGLCGTAERFVQAARAVGRRACFFGVEDRFQKLTGLKAVLMGHQPSWSPQEWETTLRETPSLREQVRRAGKKGLRVRPVSSGEILDAGAPLRVQLEALMVRWRRSRGMPSMRFLVELEPFVFSAEKRYWVAEQDGVPRGFLAAVPVYQRQGWLLEDLIRDYDAPNGTAEKLFSEAMHVFAAEGCGYVTLGLAPLTGPVGALLRAARFVGRGLYDFAGLQRFKAKLRPSEWSPIALAIPPGVGALRALLDVLTAFAGGSLTRFAWETLLKGPAFFVQLLAALLVPWMALLAVAPWPRWFPSREVWAGWLGFDAALALALFALARRFRPWLGITLASAVSLDAALTGYEAATFNLPRLRSPFEALAVGVAVGAPSVAAAFLWRVVAQKRVEGLPHARRPGP